MKLHARSPLFHDLVLDVELVDDDAPGPVLRTSGGLYMTVQTALAIYDVIDASNEERRILARHGHPFGGVQ
jgi:hypothetical protein